MPAVHMVTRQPQADSQPSREAAALDGEKACRNFEGHTISQVCQGQENQDYGEMSSFHIYSVIHSLSEYLSSTKL